jgi:hypothetical protein
LLSGNLLLPVGYVNIILGAIIIKFLNVKVKSKTTSGSSKTLIAKTTTTAREKKVYTLPGQKYVPKLCLVISKR